MTLSALSAGIFFVVAWLIWKVFRALTAGSPLDKIPGPPSPSFLTGKVDSRTISALLDFDSSQETSNSSFSEKAVWRS